MNIRLTALGALMALGLTACETGARLCAENVLDDSLLDDAVCEPLFEPPVEGEGQELPE